MFGKMRLLVGCRSGMTVKFASKFHHGNPFVRGLLFAGSAAPFKGEGAALFGASAVSDACGLLCRSVAPDARLCDAAFAGAVSARTKAGSCCAGDRMKAISCIGRRMDAPRTFCVAVPRRCAQRVLLAVPRRPAHSARICAIPFIVVLAPHGGRKGQENYTDSRPLPHIPCFASTCSLGAIPARCGT